MMATIPSVSKGDWIRLQIMQIENPSSIWACEIEGNESRGRVQEYKLLKEELNQYFNDFSTQKIPINNPVHHQVCIARRNQDRTWHRVRIEDRVGNSRIYSCFMLDEGSMDSFNQEWLRQAPQQFTRVPYQAKLYRLAGIKPLSLQTNIDATVTKQPAKRWDPVATIYITKTLRAYPSVVAQVMHIQRSGTIHIRLYVGIDRLCVNDELVKLKHAYSTQQYDTSDISADERGAVSSGPRVDNNFNSETHASLTHFHAQQEKQMPTEPNQNVTIVENSQSPPKSVGRGIMALAKMKVSTPPGPGPGSSDEKVSSKPHVSGNNPGFSQPRNISLSETDTHFPGIKPLKNTASSPGTKVAGVADSLPMGRGRGRKALMVALAETKIGVNTEADQPNLDSNVGLSEPESTKKRTYLDDMPGLEDIDQDDVPKSSQESMYKYVSPKAASLKRVPCNAEAVTFAVTSQLHGEMPASSRSGLLSHLKNGPHSETSEGIFAGDPRPVLEAQPKRVSRFNTGPEFFSEKNVSCNKEHGLSIENNVCSSPNKEDSTPLAVNNLSSLNSNYSAKHGRQNYNLENSDSTDQELLLASIVSKPHTSKDSTEVLRSQKHDNSSVTPTPATAKEHFTRSAPLKPSPSLGGNVIPIPKFCTSVESRLPRIAGIGTSSLKKSNDSDSQLESRLPRFAERTFETKRASKRLDTGHISEPEHVIPPRSIVQQTEKHHSDTQLESRLPAAATIAVKKCKSVSSSDSEKNSLGRQSAAVDSSAVKLPLKKSVVCEEDRSVMKLPDDHSYDSSPENAEFESVQLSGFKRDQWEQVLRYDPESESDMFTYFGDQETPSNDDLGVLLDGDMLPTFMQNTKLLFDSTMNKVIDRLDIMPTNLQSYCWPALLRLRNVVSVSSSYRPAPSHGGAKQGGTTFAYLVPLVAQLLQKSVYAGVPAGVGPLALILCSSWKRVNNVFKQVEQLLGRDIHLRTIQLYGAGCEQSQEIHLINGCTLLIATPKCLLRMVDRSIVEVKRMCHMVLDDGDKLLEYQKEQVEEIMTRYKDCMDTQEDRSAPRQVVLMGKHWTPRMSEFTDQFIPDPTVIIASMAQGAIYCKVKKIVHIVRADQRLTQLAGLLECFSVKKTVIFTDSPLTATAVHESLMHFSVYAILCHEDLPLTLQDAARKEWSAPYSPTSPPVLVMTDNMLCEQWQRDAEMAIHYDPPMRKDYFGPRLWCMYRNFECPLQPSENPKEATSVLLITEEWKPYINLVIKDLGHSNQEVPDKLHELADSLISSKEKEKYTELCHAFKAYGQCSREHVCLSRHSIQARLDAPGLQPLHQPLPSSGSVKVLVMSVEDASRLWVRLLEHEGGGEVTDYRTNYTRFSFAMAMHYSVEANRVPCGYPSEEELYVVKDRQHIYNRVKILKIFYKFSTKAIENVLVRMVDVGDILSVDPSQLLLMHESFRKIPFQVVEAYVCGVKPIDDDPDWTSHASIRVWEAVFSEELHGRIVLALGNTLWLDPLVKREYLETLGTVTHSVVVHRSLLDNDLAVPNPEHLQLLYKACVGNVDLPDVLDLRSIPHMAYDIHGLPTALRNATLSGNKLELTQVEVTAVLHPGLFYARLSQNVKKLKELHEEIKDYVKVNTPSTEALSLIKPGSLVLTTSPLDEDEEVKTWYRGKVQDVVGNQYDIFFLDTGESEYVAIDQVLPLPIIFSHWPFQAIECCLPYVLPVKGNEWSEDVGDPLWLLVSEAAVSPIPLLAEVISTHSAKNIGITKYAVRLFDTNIEFDIDVAQELVIQGHVCPTRQMIQRDMPAFDENISASYKDLPKLCTELVLSMDSNRRIYITDQIQQIIRSNQHAVADICKSGTVAALCVTLGYLCDMEIMELLSKCLLLLTKLDPSVFGAIVDGDGVTILCRILARVNKEGHRIASSTISELVQQQRLREEFVNRGVLRLLSNVLYQTESEDGETITQALVAIREMALALTERHRPIVLRSECVAALCHQLENSSTHVHLANCLQALRSLFNNVKIQEESRRWAVPALCKHLRAAVERPRLANPVVLALSALAQGSRINKEALVDYQIFDALQALRSNPMLTEEGQTECSDLYDSLMSIRRIGESPETYQHRPCSPCRSDGGSNSEGDAEIIRPRNAEYSNIPIPRESLNTIVKRTHPPVKWFQDRRNLILLIQVKNVSGNLLVDIKEQLFTFRALVERVEYSLELRLFELINPDKCETQVRPGEVRIGLRKVTCGNWPRVTYAKVKPPYLAPDFEHYIDESESDSDSEYHSDKDNETPLEILERCKPRPKCLPVPPADYIGHHKSREALPYDPSDDPNFKSQSSEEDFSDDDKRHIEEHEEDIERQFFNL